MPSPIQGGNAWFSRIVQTVTTAASQSTIPLTVPSGYTNATVKFQGRGDAVANSVAFLLQFNGDTAGNYDWAELQAYTGSVTVPSLGTADTSAQVDQVTAASGTASHATGTCIDIPNYAGTTFFKNFMARGGHENSTTTAYEFHTGLWRSTNAITSILLKLSSGNFVDGSVATLIME